MPEPRRRRKRKWTRAHKLGGAAAVCVAAIALATVFITQGRLTDSRATTPATLLEPGWQFYTRPTSRDAPGTVFRIDGDRRRFNVEDIPVPVSTGAEVFGASSLTIHTTARILARFIGGREGVAGQQGDRAETIQFEMFDVEKEVTTDMGIAGLLSAFRSRVTYLDDNRYYLIRESRSAMAIRYSLTENVVNSLAGEGGLANLVKADTGLSYEKRGSYVVDQKLPQRMRVMFLAEEIVPTSSMVGTTPRFQTVPVNETLIWR